MMKLPFIDGDYRAMRMRLAALAAAVLVLLLSGCAALERDGVTYIVLWHSWEDTAAETLNQVIDGFDEVFPNIRVVSTYIPADNLLEQYTVAAVSGLGPDIFIGSNNWLRTMVDEELVRPVDTEIVAPTTYYPGAIAALRHDDLLYGVPLAMRLQALFYNREQVESPPDTLEELLAQAESGQGIAINTRFSRIVWGLQAFGGQIFDAEGRVLLNEGAFANWLAWLRAAEDVDNIFLSRDEETLFNLFLEGRVAYYVGNADRIFALREAFGLRGIGAAPLPSGPFGPSGPLLELDVLYLNASSSDAQTEAAESLALFLTNIEQSSTFMRELGLVPANRRISVDVRTYPDVAGFIAQSRTAITPPNIPQLEVLRNTGDESVIRVLEGILDPATAAAQITNEVNAAFGFESAATNAIACAPDGTLVIWYNWVDPGAEVLETILDEYTNACPDVVIDLVYRPERDLHNHFIRSVTAEAADNALNEPDMFIGVSTATRQLVEAGAIQAISGELLQRYLPLSQDTLAYESQFYGIPLAIIVQVMFYNNTLVDDPAVSLDDLLNQALNGTAMTLPQSFLDTLWGATAFDGVALNDRIGVLRLKPEGFEAWLTWFTAMRDIPNVDISLSQTLAMRPFLAGEAAYYIGYASSLQDIYAALPNTQVSVSPIPPAVGGAARPLVRTEALYLSSELQGDDLERALNIAAYLTVADNQERFAASAFRVPTNVNADVSEDAVMSEFLVQAQNGFVLPNNEVNEAISTLTNTQYSSLMAEQITILEVLEQLTVALSSVPIVTETAPDSRPPQATATSAPIGAPLGETPDDVTSPTEAAEPSGGTP